MTLEKGRNITLYIRLFFTLILNLQDVVFRSSLLLCKFPLHSLTFIYTSFDSLAASHLCSKIFLSSSLKFYINFEQL